MRVSFMGTPAFALPSLTALMAAGHDICLVVTQPDRPAGRGRVPTPPPVKLAAQELGLPILQPEKVGESAIISALQAAQPEAIIVVAYGQLLPKPILTLPPYGCLNLHASLLPKYRGAAPIPQAIIQGETATGVTIMQIEARMDAGPILMQQREPIGPRDTAGTVGERLAVIGSQLLCQAIDQVARKTVHPIPQDEGLATYAPKLTVGDTHLDWARDARILDCLIRGLCPVPGAATSFEGRRVKVLEATVEAVVDPSPGTVCAVDQKKGILIAARSGGLWLAQVQPENRRVMTAAAFASGYRVRPGDVFGPS
ncbi:MAG: methionyl-tRNA formyltransferase [Candidatus Methylomirabilis oxygeniifera]|uniref:Methionyl-tRNA formyltransferase n=1 Tax=Methylomirabilis oxygeniifera TaxID=671143 RepID=D5MGR6_METO1|nr:MAG: methionyl-tRNA formyltransferase [Candidatus Methylomirabilis oxyfera]CBE68947.1 Methionyl-tRNA formyltransferase [Candidatus Methylomirabilis oxyfera]